jgi:hypothetical protein
VEAGGEFADVVEAQMALALEDFRSQLSVIQQTAQVGRRQAVLAEQEVKVRSLASPQADGATLLILFAAWLRNGMMTYGQKANDESGNRR